jgi:hypothetical protein
MGWSTIPKVITGVKALSKTGAKTVSEWKNKASMSRIKAATFNYKEGVKKAMKKMKDIK